VKGALRQSNAKNFFEKKL